MTPLRVISANHGAYTRNGKVCFSPPKSMRLYCCDFNLALHQNDLQYFFNIKLPDILIHWSGVGGFGTFIHRWTPEVIMNSQNWGLQKRKTLFTVNLLSTQDMFLSLSSKRLGALWESWCPIFCTCSHGPFEQLVSGSNHFASSSQSQGLDPWGSCVEASVVGQVGGICSSWELLELAQEPEYHWTWEQVNTHDYTSTSIKAL